VEKAIWRKEERICRDVPTPKVIMITVGNSDLFRSAIPTVSGGVELELSVFDTPFNKNRVKIQRCGEEGVREGRCLV